MRKFISPIHYLYCMQSNFMNRMGKLQITNMLFSPFTAQLHVNHTSSRTTNSSCIFLLCLAKPATINFPTILHIVLLCGTTDSQHFFRKFCEHVFDYTYFVNELQLNKFCSNTFSINTQYLQLVLNSSNGNKVLVMASMYISRDCYLLKLMDMIKYLPYIT